MKNCFLIFVLLHVMTPKSLDAQDKKSKDRDTQNIYTLIDSYSRARENKDTILLKNILTTDVDQLVSTGEWRTGLAESVQGMLRSSATSPGTRTLTVDKIRFLDSKNALADARYDIRNADGTSRKMWSTFIVVQQHGRWKIAAIRNMLPSGTN